MVALRKQWLAEKRIAETQAVPIPLAVPLRLRGSGSTCVIKIQPELAGELPAGERHVGAGDEATRSAGEETGQGREIVRPAEPLQRNGGEQEFLRAFGPKRGCVPQPIKQRRSPSGLPLNLDGSP